MEPDTAADLNRLRRSLCAHLEALRKRKGECEELAVCLWRDPAAARVRAARRLQDYGPLALEPLCGALRDHELNVRVAAAESLGYIGDERAVQPLTEALRHCFVGQSAHRQLVVG